MPWSSETFIASIVEALTETSSTNQVALVEELTREAAREILDDEAQNLQMILAERRSGLAAFRVRLRARWGPALDLLELLFEHCFDIGSGSVEAFAEAAGAADDNRFSALALLHAKALLTMSEILTLMATGHATGAMARWRTLHETDVVAAFIAQNSDNIAHRYLRHEDAQTLKMRLSYDANSDRLGYPPTEVGIDGDPTELRDSLIDEFGKGFLGRNGWAAPAFSGRIPKDAGLEVAVGLDHLRPYVYLASEGVHATPKGLKPTLQVLGDDERLIAGPTNAGLADPGHGAALSLMRVTSTFALYATQNIKLQADGDLPDVAMSTTLTLVVLLELCDQIGEAFLRASSDLDSDESLQ